LKYIFENSVEFYITNICNLTCENCNRFNNHKFSGWQRWTDYADIYQQWSEYIKLKNIVILGGEPLLNPTITDWITGLSKVFKSPVQVLTNGLHLNKVVGLYDAMVQTRQYNAKGCFIQISLHNTEHFDQIRQNIKNFLSTPVEEYGTSVGLPSSVPGRNSYYSLRDVNNVLVNVHLDNNFFDAAVYKNNQGQFTLRNSDPFLAHQACGFAGADFLVVFAGLDLPNEPLKILPFFVFLSPLPILFLFK
jgi:hypothetical protein